MPRSDRCVLVVVALLLVCGPVAAQSRTAAPTTSAESRSRAFFAEHDKDGDDRLTKQEFPERLVRLFDRMDGNRDGFVDLAEDTAYRNRPRRPSQVVPPGVRAVRDLVYARVGENSLLLDLYVPERGDEKLPLIVWVHGGAWRAGNKQRCPALPFTSEGFVAASVSYRLSQQARFPAQIEDCKAAIRWLRAHAAKYRIDPDRIGVWGSSAGGHLVALLGTAGDVAELEGKSGNLDQSSRVQAVCDFFGPTDFLRMDADSLPGGRIIHNAADSPESQLVGGPIQAHPDRVARANPITYVTADDPPFLIVHGDQDPLVPWQQSQYLFDSMKKAGLTQVTFHKVQGAGHGFQGRQDVTDMVVAFFKDTLRKRQASL